MMDNLLSLMKRIEWRGRTDEFGDDYRECPECEWEKHQDHHQSCELKAMIDKLEAEQIKSKKARITGNWGDPMGPYILDLGDAENRK